MFDNLGTALVQAVGFFGVFGFFVYQLLSDGKKNIKTKSSRKKVNELKDMDIQARKKGLFNRNTVSIKEERKPKKKSLFGRKVEPSEVPEKPKKKGWFK